MANASILTYLLLTIVRYELAFCKVQFWLLIAGHRQFITIQASLNGYANFLVFEFILYYNMHKEDAGRKMYGISENQFPVSP